MLNHDYTTNDIFNKNFFNDWRKTMSSDEKKLITDLKKCNFRKMNTYFTEQSELRKARSKDEKQVTPYCNSHCHGYHRHKLIISHIGLVVSWSSSGLSVLILELDEPPAIYLVVCIYIAYIQQRSFT